MTNPQSPIPNPDKAAGTAGDVVIRLHRQGHEEKQRELTARDPRAEKPL